MNILAADIGSTHCRFGVFSFDAQKTEPLLSLQLQKELWLCSAHYNNFEDLLLALTQSKSAEGSLFLSSPPQHTCFAVAGPIVNDSCAITQLPWLVTTAQIGKVLQTDYNVLINDLAAHAYNCFLPQLLPPTLIKHTLQHPKQHTSPIAVVGAGTGCGKCLVLQNPPTILPSEGGQANFPFTSKEQDFAEYLCTLRNTSYARTDAVLSGQGLQALFSFHTGTPFIIEQSATLLQNHPIVMEWFARFYGRVCRNYLFETLATGGLYITGGMAEYTPVLQHQACWDEMYNTPKHASIIQNIPVWQMQSHKAGVYGAAICAATSVVS